MVASAISMNQAGTTIIGRKTCLMPKIAGLSAICCLLFSPFIEIRVDSSETFYTGALCGLGYDDLNRMAIYTDNDIECIFDSIIDKRDIAMINSLRMAINMVIGCEEEVLSWVYEKFYFHVNCFIIKFFIFIFYSIEMMKEIYVTYNRLHVKNSLI